MNSKLLIVPIMLSLLFNCSIPAFAIEPPKPSSTINVTKDETINQHPYVGQISYRDMSNSIYIWTEVRITHYCHNSSWGWKIDILNKNNTVNATQIIPYLDLTPPFEGTEAEEIIQPLWIYMGDGLKEPHD